MLLQVKNIDVAYDEFQVIWNVSISIDQGEMVALLGPNGSGKSTILNSISNLIQPKNGEVLFDNKKIHLLPTYMRTKLGLSHVLERRRVFPFLTVKQNLLLGAWHSEAKIQKEKTLDEVYTMFPILSDRSNQLAHTMSGGEQQMLAIARGLMSIPKLLMVDEPFLGLSPKMIEKIKEIFNEIVNKGIAILFVEQNVKLALNMADRGYVLESGHLVIEGKSDALLKSEKLKKVFLG
jgi:branched-chain amino acid transport system ATP-binding protein